MDENVPVKTHQEIGWTRERDSGYLNWGQRQDFVAAGENLAEVAADEIRAKIAKPDFVDSFHTSLLEGIKKRDRTCMNLYAKILKLVDADRVIVNKHLHYMGCATVDEAKAWVELAKNAQFATPEDGIAGVGEYLMKMQQTHPERVAEVIRMLGGLIPVPERVV